MNRLYEEVAYIGYYMHWPYEQIMHMEHAERQRWLAEITRIHERIDGDTRGGVWSH